MPDKIKSLDGCDCQIIVWLQCTPSGRLLHVPSHGREVTRVSLPVRVGRWSFTQPSSALWSHQKPIAGNWNDHTVTSCFGNGNANEFVCGRKHRKGNLFILCYCSLFWCFVLLFIVLVIFVPRLAYVFE